MAGSVEGSDGDRLSRDMQAADTPSEVASATLPSAPPPENDPMLDAPATPDQPQAATRRWDPGVDHRGADAVTFFSARWGGGDRRVLLVAGAGFDPRAARVPRLLGELARDRLRIVLVREERPSADAGLVGRAGANLTTMRDALPAEVAVDDATINVFGVGDAVIGGREAAKLASRLELAGVDDIVIDFSALSIGISFPLTALLLARAAAAGVNVHAVVVADPAVDAGIRPLPSESAITVHGFHHGWRLDATEGASKLWLPQLAHGRSGILERIFREVAPHDICPILPFPAADPRRGDRLIEEFLEEFESTWEVDQRSIIYAAENSPLDVYRTVLALDDERRPVFEGHGGSICVLSPVGTKVLALGTLLAATERRFPVLYVEAVGYEVDAQVLDSFSATGGELVHVWLEGEPYAATTFSGG